MGWLLHDKTHVWAPAWEGWLTLAGLVFFAWPCPSLCHSWHLTASTPPLTLFMPSLAGMWLVYLLWPAARVKGTFWPHLGRGHLRVVQWLRCWCAYMCMCVGVGRWRQSEGDGRTSGWKSSVLCMCVIICDGYIWVCDIHAWSKGNMPHCNCFWGMACTGRSLRVYCPD